jgi:capsular polysaccharide biosynthesis protein
MTEHHRRRTQRYLVICTRWLAVAALVYTLTIAAGGFVTGHLLKKIYRATVVLEVETPPNDDASRGTWFSSPKQTAMQEELAVIDSPAVLEPVVAKLDLTDAWTARFHRESDPLTTDEALRRLQGMVRAEFPVGSDLADLSVASDNPREAAGIANAVAVSYALARQNPPSSPLYIGAAGRPVRILEPAQVPGLPAWPNREFCSAVTTVTAVALGVMMATCVEVVLLIIRAEQAQRALEALPCTQ